MEIASDSYKTLSNPSEEILFKERKSKFYGYAFPVQKEAEVKPIIEELKRRHPSANHICYAWQLGVKNPNYRANDAGEPNNSAGMPIYGQIQSFEVTNVLVAVARVFGGTKLGVGGLIMAYKNAAKLSLERSKIVTRTLKQGFKLTFQYAEMDIVMRTIKQKRLKVVSQKLEMDCELIISVRKKESKNIKTLFEAIYNVNIESIKSP